MYVDVVSSKGAWKLGVKTLRVNAQGMCQRLGEPKCKKNTYCMNLKRRIEGWSRKFGKNGVRMQIMRNLFAKLLMQYMTGARKS